MQDDIRWRSEGDKKLFCSEDKGPPKLLCCAGVSYCNGPVSESRAESHNTHCTALVWRLVDGVAYKPSEKQNLFWFWEFHMEDFPVFLHDGIFKTTAFLPLYISNACHSCIVIVE